MKKIQRVHPGMYRNAVNFSWSGLVQKLAIMSTLVIFTPSYDREMRIIGISISMCLWITWALMARQKRRN